MGQLDGKVAIITGASHGIGRGIAVAFGKEGAKVMISARRLPELQETAASIAACGGTCEVVQCDVQVEEQIENMFKKTMEKFGRVDVLVNNAGVFNGAPLDEMKTDAWDQVINTGLRASFIATRAAMRIMKKQKVGRIINIGSISAQRTRMNNSAYTANKFALTGLTHSTALEGRDHGITCGILHPGVVHTRGPSKEPGMELEEIAAAAVYMAAAGPKVNVFEMIQLPIDQAYLGRG